MRLWCTPLAALLSHQRMQQLLLFLTALGLWVAYMACSSVTAAARHRCDHKTGADLPRCSSWKVAERAPLQGGGQRRTCGGVMVFVLAVVWHQGGLRGRRAQHHDREARRGGGAESQQLLLAAASVTAATTGQPPW